jgi:hypothetical protein
MRRQAFRTIIRGLRLFSEGTCVRRRLSFLLLAAALSLAVPGVATAKHVKPKPKQCMPWHVCWDARR